MSSTTIWHHNQPLALSKADWSSKQASQHTTVKRKNNGNVLQMQSTSRTDEQSEVQAMRSLHVPALLDRRSLQDEIQAPFHLLLRMQGRPIRALNNGGLPSKLSRNIAGMKYAKLLLNLINPINALSGVTVNKMIPKLLALWDWMVICTIWMTIIRLAILWLDCSLALVL